MRKSESDLERFVEAQEPVIDTALAELKAGRKRSHWMWFVFPQLRGLGRSSTAHYYGIMDRAEADAFLAHPVLGPRLGLATRTVLTCAAPSLNALFGSPDELKFRSSMTLFAALYSSEKDLFRRALDRWCGGQDDSQTLTLLTASDRARPN